MEKKKVEDAKVEEIKNSSPKKKSNAFWWGTLVTFMLVVVGGFLLWKEGILNLNLFKKKEVELTYTQTTNTIKDGGVYVTDVSDIVEDVMPSIVSITSKTLVSSGRFGFSYYGGEQYTEGAGSGIIVGKSDKELLILTNNHVVSGAKELSVQFINEKSYDATIKGTSERKDIAVISIKLSDLDAATIETIRIATLGDSNTLKVGDGVIAIGNALGYGQSVTTGVVSALNREVSIDNYTYKMIQIDAAINGGNSGGALLDASGAVVGINSAKYSSSGYSNEASIEGMGFAIPISDVKELITKLMNGEEDVPSGTLGIEGYDISENNNMGIPEGFYISGITSGGAGDKAGLEIGYVVTKIDGKKVTGVSDIRDVLYTKNKGDVIELTVKYPSGRQYKEKTIKVTLS